MTETREIGKQFLVLVRHFVLRMFNNDVLTYENERRERVVVILVMLAAAGGFVARKLLSPYLYSGFSGASPQNIWIRKTAFLTLTMAMTGLFSVINWENIFPDKKDYHNLLVLPLTRKTFFAAKFTGLLIFVGVLSLAFNALALMVFTFFLADMVYVNPFYFAFTHFFSNFLGNLFVFLAVAAIQAVLTLVSGNRLFKRISGLIQMVLLMGFISVFFWLPKVYFKLYHMKAMGDSFLYYYPPMWFTGLYEKMVGNADVFFTGLLVISLVALVLPAVFYLVSAQLTFRRFLNGPHNGKKQTAPAVGGIISTGRESFHRWFLRDPVQRGVFYFILNTLRRSKFHRLQLTMYLALPVSYYLTKMIWANFSIGLPFFQARSFFMAAVPLMLYFFVILGVRMVVRHPVMLEANWVFRLTEDQDKKHYVKGLKKALVFFAGLPMFVVMFGFYFYCWGLGPAVYHSLYAASVFFLLMEAFFASYKKIPFAGACDPGKPNLKLYWLLYLAGFVQYVMTFTKMGLFFLREPHYYLLYFAVVLGVHTLLVLKRYEMYREEDFTFIYDEEEPEPLMMTFS